MAESGRDRTTPQYFYNQQKQSAKARGIAWEFANWQEWYAVWEASGKWELRGRNKGQYVMARHNDAGAYRADNVSIVEAGKNGSDGLKDWGKKKKAREAQEAGINTSDAAFASPAALRDARQFWKEEIKPQTTHQPTKTNAKEKKKIFIRKEKELNFLQKLLSSLINWFKEERRGERRV